MRKARNYTLQQISDLSGVPLQTVRRIFEGTTADPGITTISAIVDALGYTLNDLTNDVDLSPSVYESARAQRNNQPMTYQNFRNDALNAMRSAAADIYANEAVKALHSQLKWWRAVCLVLVFLVALWFTWDVTHPTMGFIQYEVSAETQNTTSAYRIDIC